MFETMVAHSDVACSDGGDRGRRRRGYYPVGVLRLWAGRGGGGGDGEVVCGVDGEVGGVFFEVVTARSIFAKSPPCRPVSSLGEAGFARRMGFPIQNRPAGDSISRANRCVQDFCVIAFGGYIRRKDKKE